MDYSQVMCRRCREAEQRAAELEAERDKFHAELAGQIEDNEKQAAQYSRLVSERDAIKAERDGIRRGQWGLVEQAVAFTAELEALLEYNKHDRHVPGSHLAELVRRFKCGAPFSEESSALREQSVRMEAEVSRLREALLKLADAQEAFMAVAVSVPDTATIDDDEFERIECTRNAAIDEARALAATKEST